MRAFFSKRWIITVQVTVLLMALMACQLTQIILQSVGSPATSQVDSGTTPVEVVFGPGSLRLVDPTVGLANLSSYKATLTLSFNGTLAGQPSQWSHNYVMLADQINATHQVTIEAAGGVPAPVFMLEMNGVSYELDGEKNCSASTTPADSSLSSTWEPAGFLSGLIGAEAAGSETINGVAADHYTFDERALGQTGFTKSTGQVWVASETGVVVRYLLTTNAGSDYFGEGIEGAQTWEYNLTDVNLPVTIDLPAGCPGGLVYAPLMPAAQSVRYLPGVTIYSIAGSIQDVFAFYQQQLPVLGWEAMGEPGEVGTMGVAIFVQGDQQLTVIGKSTENGIEVRLLMATVTNP